MEAHRMSAQPSRIRGASFVVVETPAKPTPIVGQPVRLQPVQFGKRDSALARVVCNAIVEAAPVTVIRFNPLTHARMRRDLRSLGIKC
jgi:hypothetical protein